MVHLQYRLAPGGCKRRLKPTYSWNALPAGRLSLLFQGARVSSRSPRRTSAPGGSNDNRDRPQRHKRQPLREASVRAVGVPWSNRSPGHLRGARGQRQRSHDAAEPAHISDSQSRSHDRGSFQLSGVRSVHRRHHDARAFPVDTRARSDPERGDIPPARDPSGRRAMELSQESWSRRKGSRNATKPDGLVTTQSDSFDETRPAPSRIGSSLQQQFGSSQSATRIPRSTRHPQSAQNISMPPSVGRVRTRQWEMTGRIQQDRSPTDEDS